MTLDMISKLPRLNRMTEPAPRRRRGTAIPINGPALREIRLRTGLGIVDLASTVNVTEAYISKIECGHSRHVSPLVFSKLNIALQITDQRVLRGVVVEAVD